MAAKTIIVSPVYNDWESFQRLIEELGRIDAIQIDKVIAVDDGSTSLLYDNFQTDIPITILELHNNMGHQRAISIGLSYVNDLDDDFEYLVVMDCDGEDQPSDIEDLITLVKSRKNNLVGFAKRQKRTEGLVFKFFYRVYKLSFYILTSQRLDFGNFSCMPKAMLSKVVTIPEIWNHYSGGIMRSKLNYDSIGTNKGQRYSGTSKMNFQNLILHGLSSISIYLDIVAVRLLLISFVFVIISLVGIPLIFTFGLYNQSISSTAYWLPIFGWVLLLFMIIFMTLFLLLTLLNQRTKHNRAPKSFYKDFIFTIHAFNK